MNSYNIRLTLFAANLDLFFTIGNQFMNIHECSAQCNFWMIVYHNDTINDSFHIFQAEASLVEVFFSWTFFIFHLILRFKYLILVTFHALICSISTSTN